MSLSGRGEGGDNKGRRGREREQGGGQREKNEADEERVRVVMKMTPVHITHTSLKHVKGVSSA